MSVELLYLINGIRGYIHRLYKTYCKVWEGPFSTVDRHPEGSTILTRKNPDVGKDTPENAGKVNIWNLNSSIVITKATSISPR